MYTRPEANPTVAGKNCGGSVEFVEAFAEPLPPEVFAILFGLPVEDRDRLARWASDIAHAFNLSMAPERLKVGRAWHDLGLVFSTEIGTLVDPSNYRRQLSKVTEAAGLGHWSPNELRHSAVSLLSAAGVPLEQIADVVGHDGTRMTAGVYRHAVTPSVDAAVAPMEALFGN